MDNVLQELFIDGLSINNIESTSECIRIELNSTKKTQECPMCHELSTSKHCSYTRTVSDLPVVGKRLILIIYTHKFKCKNSECKVKVFCQQFDGFLTKNQRKTGRLIKYLYDIAFANSGEGGSRICCKNNIPVSGDTLIRMVKLWNPSKVQATKVGVDDWAYKKNIHMEH